LISNAKSKKQIVKIRRPYGQLRGKGEVGRQRTEDRKQRADKSYCKLTANVGRIYLPTVWRIVKQEKTEL
jgi:hypothetical protein